MSRWPTRLKNELHRWLDPLIARRNVRSQRQALGDLPDGEYRVPFEVPYVPQFASREYINDYIHHGYDGSQDPNWQTFGTEKAEDYALWAPRVCALACLKMAIAAYSDDQSPTLWQLVQEGLELGGYTLHDEQGRWLDEGWYVAAQIVLAKRYGLQMQGYSYASPLGICQHIRAGRLVAATVTPELGERQPKTRRYAGHLVVVFGFRWQKGQPTHYLLHNPSGRYPELQSDAWIPARRFHRSYAYRFATYEKLNQQGE
jgi:hypothetical protein